MDKLDENYLDLVRDSIYRKHYNVATKCNIISSKKSKKLKIKVGDNEGTPKNIVKEGFKTRKQTFKAKTKLQNKSKKKIQPKQVTFIDNTSNDKPKSSSPLATCNEIKDRVATPFKNSKPLVKLNAKKKLKPNLNESSDYEIISETAAKVSPSLNEKSRATFYPVSSQNHSGDLNGLDKNDNNAKRKKRSLSACDSPEASRKRKKGKSSMKKGKKLIFDDSLTELELDTSTVHNGSSDIVQTQTRSIVSKKKEAKNKVLEKSSAINFPVEISWPDETESNLNNTWKNKGNKDNEKEEKPRKKKLKSKGGRTDVNIKCPPTINTLRESPNLCQPAILEPESIRPLVRFTAVDKKSDFKNEKPSHKVKKLKFKKDFLKSKKTAKKVLNSSDSSDSDIEFNPTKVSSINSAEDLVELSDSDSETVGVKGLKFQKFCNLFPPTHNEQFVGGTGALNIPKKYFNITEKDWDTDWQCEEFPSSKRKKGGNKSPSQGKTNISTVHEFETSEKGSSSQKLNHSNKKKELKKAINVLDVPMSKNIKNKLTDSIGTREDQEITEEETSDFQESENLIRSHEKLNHSPEQDRQRLNKPIVLTLKNGNKIVALNLGELMHFHGLCQITVLNGELEILGASINTMSGVKKLYSPRGTALLYIKNKKILLIDNSVKLKNLVQEEVLHSRDAERTFGQHYAIFLFTGLKEPHIDFMERYISQKIFPESNPQELRLDFKLRGSWNRLQTSERWEEVLENVPKESKTVISGGKGVGKSTFLRFAVNFLLKRFAKIRIIDLDPGQSEFYSPGCISVVVADKDVFGPNYTHLLEPVSSILSHINMGYDIKKYLKSVGYLLESVRSMEIFPTIINFPGFTQDIGLDISAETLQVLEPSLVIQIESNTQSKNYRMDLTSKNVSQVLKKNVLNQYDSNDTVHLSYDYEKLDSLAENTEAWSLGARQGREMNILSYFGKLMTDSFCDLTSAAVNMYSIKVSALSITNSDGKPLSPLAINANLVALCSKLDDNEDIFSCHGYGFVRGMDLQTDTLVLITPESVDRLENVSHLVLSSVTTPPSLIMTANGIVGHIPYVSVGGPVDFGQFTRRSYLPPRN